MVLNPLIADAITQKAPVARGQIYAEVVRSMPIPGITREIL